jgi:hypothetical protein
MNADSLPNVGARVGLAGFQTGYVGIPADVPPAFGPAMPAFLRASSVILTAQTIKRFAADSLKTEQTAFEFFSEWIFCRYACALIQYDLMKSSGYGEQ